MTTRAGEREPRVVRRAPSNDDAQVPERAQSYRSELTANTLSGELPDNVRDFLDWLIDEELKRWLREPQ